MLVSSKQFVHDRLSVSRLKVIPVNNVFFLVRFFVGSKDLERYAHTRRICHTAETSCDSRVESQLSQDLLGKSYSFFLVSSTLNADIKSDFFLCARLYMLVRLHMVR